MNEQMGEMFVEGRIVNLDKEPVENLERILSEVSEKEEKKEQKLTDKVMLNKIESLSAPKVEKKEEILELSFKVRGTKEKLKLLKQFLENGGYDYE